MGNILNCTQIETHLSCNCLVDETQRRNLKRIQDARFGLIEITQGTEKSQKMYVKERTLNLSFDTLEELNFRSQLSNPHLLKIYDWTLVNGEVGKIRVRFEAYDGDFHQELSQAIFSNCRFNEAVLTTILRSVTSALCYLQEQNISHQNITPQQILRVGGSYKLHDNYVISDSENLLVQAKRNENLRYLAPELYAYHFEKSQMIPDLFKADVYALGMLIIDAGTLNDSDKDIIDRVHKRMSNSNLQSRLKQFGSMYPNLGLIVNEMLEFDLNKRPNPAMLSERLDGFHLKTENKRKIVLSPKQLQQLKRSGSPSSKNLSSPNHQHQASFNSSVSQNGFSSAGKYLTTQDSLDNETHVREKMRGTYDYSQYSAPLDSARSGFSTAKHHRSPNGSTGIESFLVPFSSTKKKETVQSNFTTQLSETQNLTGQFAILNNLSSADFLSFGSGEEDKGAQRSSHIRVKSNLEDFSTQKPPSLSMSGSQKRLSFVEENGKFTTVQEIQRKLFADSTSSQFNSRTGQTLKSMKVKSQGTFGIEKHRKREQIFLKE